MFKIIDILLFIVLICFGILFISRIIFGNGTVFKWIEIIISIILAVTVALPLMVLLILYLIALGVLIYKSCKPTNSEN